MLQRRSHREERRVADRDQPSLARRIEELAESGDYEGFNAIAGALSKRGEFDAPAIAMISRDVEFRNRITDICHEAWKRKHSLH